MTRRIFALSIVVLLGWGSLGFAKDDKSNSKKPQADSDVSEDQATKFKGLDKNHDGRVTRDEWKGNDKSFSNHDKNHDGVITADEATDSASAIPAPVAKPGAAPTAAPAATPAPAPRATPVQSPVPTPGAHSNPPSSTPGPATTSIGALDSNKDGKISQLEWDGSPEAFKRLDLNHDGVLGPQEVASAKARPEFDKIDVNKDGKISKLEWNGDPASFNKLDVNHDGVVGSIEYGKTVSGAPPAPAPAPPSGPASSDTLDRNKDGKVSQLEWNGSPEEFKRLDLNHDGVLGPRELASAKSRPEFDKIDLNKDGKITKLEWNGDPASFKKLDVNGDGILGPLEFAGEATSVPHR